MAVDFVLVQLNVWLVNITTLTQTINIKTQLLAALDTVVRCLYRCGENTFLIKTDKSVFRTFLKQIKNDRWRFEQRFRKTGSEELLRMFPINTVIGAQKITEENKGRKKSSF